MLETAICKLFCSEGSWRVIDDALQIWGGEGYMRDNGLERMLRDARINRIVEGTTEVMTVFVALVGMKGVGEDFERVLKLARHPVGNFGRLAQFARAQWSDIVIGAHCHDLHESLRSEGNTLARMTHEFARAVARLLRTWRERILDEQLLQERIAWSAVDLYAMAAVIAKLQAMLAGGMADEGNQALVIGRAFCHHAAERISARLGELTAHKDDQTVKVAEAILGKAGEQN